MDLYCNLKTSLLESIDVRDIVNIKYRLVFYNLKGNCTENRNLRLYQEYMKFIAYNRFLKIETISKLMGTRNR